MIIPEVAEGAFFYAEPAGLVGVVGAWAQVRACPVFRLPEESVVAEVHAHPQDQICVAIRAGRALLHTDPLGGGVVAKPVFRTLIHAQLDSGVVEAPSVRGAGLHALLGGVEPVVSGRTGYGGHTDFGEIVGIPENGGVQASGNTDPEVSLIFGEGIAIQTFGHAGPGVVVAEEAVGSTALLHALPIGGIGVVGQGLCGVAHIVGVVRAGLHAQLALDVPESGLVSRTS